MKTTLLVLIAAAFSAAPAFAHDGIDSYHHHRGYHHHHHRHHHIQHGSSVRAIVPTPAGCSNAGDETSRPVYRTVNGHPVFAGWECIQDNRGGNGG